MQKEQSHGFYNYPLNSDYRRFSFHHHWHGVRDSVGHVEVKIAPPLCHNAIALPPKGVAGKTAVFCYTQPFTINDMGAKCQSRGR